MSLRAKLLAGLLAVLVALVAVLSLAVVLRAQQALIDVDRARFAAATRQLAEQLAYPVLSESDALLRPPLEAFALSPDLVEVQVRAADGRVLATQRGRATAGDRLTAAAEVKTRGHAPGEQPDELDPFGLADAEQRVVGRLEAVFSTAGSAAVQERLRRDIVVASGALGGVALLLVALIAASVARRVRALADASARVAKGELQTRVEVHGRDELAALARDFNAMTTALAGQRRQLDDAAHALAERESLAAIGRATAVIAHELRNPLGILLGAAEVVGKEERPAAQRAQAAGIIADEVRRLSSRLDQLLAYARPRAPERRPHDVRALLEGAKTRAQLPGGPAAAIDVVVVAGAERALVDEEHAAQVLLNLVQNAAQAGASRVELRARTVGDVVEVVAADDGPGVAAEVRDRLFQPFVTTRQRGAGLGLSASRRLARDNGGELRVEPSPSGARFVLTLPRAKEGP
ncbi:MAG: HAMP domain-containing histidine kinase [Deltaproteobacteria bacterium]|nr:HAMP domain-containing histidine kinase [Deltaproteobacteria bacterium]